MINENIKHLSFKHLLIRRAGIISVFIVLAAFIFNLVWLIHHERQTMQSEFNFIEDLLIPDLIVPLKQHDTSVIEHIFERPDHFEFIKQIELISEGQLFVSTYTEQQLNDELVKHYPIVDKTVTPPVNLGQFIARADRAVMYANVVNKGLMLLGLNMLLIGILIMTIVTSHKEIFNHLRKLRTLFSEKNTSESANNSESGDELEDIVEAFYAKQNVITEKNKALSLSQEKFFKIFDSSPDAILITTFHEGRVIDVNRSFYRIYEYDEKDIVIGKTAKELHLWSGTERREDWLKHLQQEGEIYLRETEYRKKSGATSTCIVCMQLIQFSDVLAIMSTIRDISQTKRYQQRILHSQQRLYNLSRSQEEMLENERIGIAREIHDELGQSFTSLKIDLSWIKEERSEDDDLVKRINMMISNIDQSVDSVRRISSDLRPPVLDDLGLEAAIEWYSEQFSNRTGIKHKLTLNCDELALSHHRDTAIFRIYQEALTNIARHSEATEFEAKIEMTDSHILLSVTDNGKGIKQEELTSVTSIGIIGMQERAERINASISIRNHIPKGAQVSLICPIDLAAVV